MSTANAGDNPVREEDETVGSGRTEDLGSSLGSAEFRSLEPSIRDDKFHWSLPEAINPDDIGGSVNRNINALEKVYRDVCCRKALFVGENVHLHAAMIHQALCVLRAVASACVAK